MPIIGGVSGQVPETVSKDVPLSLFGGLLLEMVAGDLPEGASPDNQNVDFQPGSVFTRAGLTALFSSYLQGNVNYTKDYSLPNLNLELLVLDSSGNFFFEDSTNAPGILTLIQQVKAGSYAQSVSAFGREYIAFSDSQFGIDMPRQWDGTNFDRVSQVGPGAPPTATDSVGSIAITSATQEGTAPITEIFELVPNLDIAFTSSALHSTAGTLITVAGVAAGGYNGNFNTAGTYTPGTATARSIFEYPNPITPLPPEAAGGTVASSFVTITTATPHGLAVGNTAIVAGVGAGYNGNQIVESVPNPTTFTFFASVTGLSPLGAGGTVEKGGIITAGVHQVVVSFLTREGYITRPSPPVSWTAAGSHTVTVTNLPIGPNNVVARILSFTAAGGDFFFYIPIPTTGSSTGTVVNDNTSTSATLDFSDNTLLAATSIDQPGNNLFALDELGECLGVTAYASRLFWWGERNKLQNFLNLTFDGAFSLGTGTGGSDVPLGWTSNSANGGGGSRVNPGYENFGFAYRFTGDGVHPFVGQITQGAFADYLNVPILLPNTGYSIRIKIKRNTALTNASFVVSLASFSTGFFSTATVLGSSMTTSYQEFIVPFTVSIPSSVPTDLMLNIFAGLATNGQNFDVDDLQIFPTAQPFLNTNVRVSYVDNPESFDGVTGNIGISDLNDQSVTCLFKLRDNLYITKQNSLFYTSDNGQTEPSQWTVSTISSQIGTYSVNGVSIGEEWALIVSRYGLYLFNGNEPVKISQEIQSHDFLPAWEEINWGAGSKVWSTNDILNRRTIIGVPISNSTIPNLCFMMNYREVNFSDALAQASPIHVSYSGRVVATDLQRKWSRWTISANCGAIVQRPGNVQQMMFGNNTGTNKLYFLDTTATADDGVAIDSYWDSYFMPNRDQEQGLQLGSHRHGFTYLTMFVSGQGTLMTTVLGDSLISGRTQLLANRTLSLTPSFDTELGIYYTADRISIQFRTNAVGHYFNLTHVCVSMSQDPFIRVRGRT